jgi:mRNA interferase RelE/StbE
MYRLEATRAASKELRRLARGLLPRIVDAIDGLAENPRPAGCKKLRGQDAYAIRVGDYRVLYLVDDDRQIVTVVKVKHRRDVYKDL